MRIFNVLAGLLLATTAAAWQPEDHEIFRLNDDVQAREGANATFYSFLGVNRKAKRTDIDRAFRKKSVRMHPDKARQFFINDYGKKHAAENDDGAKSQTAKKANAKRPSKREVDTFVKDATKRYERLTVITEILRGPMRDRYDFFLDHGFPTWRGTGYYYKRYRPGAGTVIFGLFVVMGGVAHYGALLVGWKRQRAFAQRYVEKARQLAWGNNMVVPGLDQIGVSAPAPAESGESDEGPSAALNRRQKRQQEKEAKKKGKKGVVEKGVPKEEISEPVDAKLISGPQGSKRRVVAENGKVLVVDSVGNVFLEETTEEGETHEYLIDVDEIAKPRITDTILFQLPVWAWNKTGGRLLGNAEAPSLHDSETLDHDDDPVVSATALNANGESRRRNRAKVRQRKL